MREITFGQYYPASSFVHKLDPRVKILFLIGYIVSVFVSKSFYGLGVCALALAIIIIFSKVPLGNVLSSVKGVIIIFIFTAVLNVFFYRAEGDPLVEWGIIKIYLGGIYYSVFLIVRLFLLVVCSTVLTLTTTPVSLTDGIESLLTPLKFVRFPVHELALVMSIALRFIPTLVNETDRIMNAQKARGADFENGSFFSRIKAMVPILIPLLISSFRRAEELGDAMDARCYAGSKKRTKYKKLTLSWRDIIAFILFAAVLAGVILTNIFLPMVI